MGFIGGLMRAGISSNGEDVDIWNGDLDVDGDLTVDTDLAVAGDAAVTGALTVTGKTQGSNLHTASVTLTNAEIKALAASPKELVAAPGAGKLLEFVSAMLILTAGTEVLTEADDNLAIEYDDGSAVAASGTIEATGFIDQAADTVTNALPAADAIDASADIVNKNLALVNLADEFAGNATADATMEVIITYRVHTPS